MNIYSSVIAPWNNLVRVLESRFRKFSKLFNFNAVTRVFRSGVNDPELKNMSTDRTLLKIHKTNIFTPGLIPLFKRFEQNIYPKQSVTACLFAFGLISSLSHAEKAESKEQTPMVNHAWGNLYGFH